MDIKDRFKHLEKTVNIIKNVLMKSSMNKTLSFNNEKDIAKTNDTKTEASSCRSNESKSLYQSDESNDENEDSNSDSGSSTSESDIKPSREELEKSTSEYKTNMSNESWTRVEVKIEPMTVPETMEPLDSVFHRDINGILLRDCSKVSIINSSCSVDEAKKHIETGKRPESYFECPYCSLLFKHPKRFLIHTKWHTFGLTNEQRLKLASKKNTIVINRAKIREENDKNEFECDKCKRVYTTRKRLKRHRQKSHPTEPVEVPAPRTCHICHKTFPTPAKLKFHMTAHVTTRAFQCTECPKNYKYASSLNNHMGSHMESIHGCELCGKKFGSPKLLRMHVQRHEKVLSEPTLKCQYCDKMYRLQAELVVHERSHTNEKPFTCEYCHSKYVSNSSLKRHIQRMHKPGKGKHKRNQHDSENQDSDMVGSGG